MKASCTDNGHSSAVGSRSGLGDRKCWLAFDLNWALRA